MQGEETCKKTCLICLHCLCWLWNVPPNRYMGGWAFSRADYIWGAFRNKMEASGRGVQSSTSIMKVTSLWRCTGKHTAFFNKLWGLSSHVITIFNQLFGKKNDLKKPPNREQHEKLCFVGPLQSLQVAWVKTCGCLPRGTSKKWFRQMGCLKAPDGSRIAVLERKSKEDKPSTYCEPVLLVRIGILLLSTKRGGQSNPTTPSSSNKPWFCVAPCTAPRHLFTMTIDWSSSHSPELDKSA